MEFRDWRTSEGIFEGEVIERRHRIDSQQLFPIERKRSESLVTRGVKAFYVFWVTLTRPSNF